MNHDEPSYWHRYGLVMKRNEQPLDERLLSPPGRLHVSRARGIAAVAASAMAPAPRPSPLLVRGPLASRAAPARESAPGRLHLMARDEDS